MNVSWEKSSSSDPLALSIVDGTGNFSRHGPHYSRRTPYSKTFTGVGQEIVLISSDGAAVWAVVRQKTPMRRGSGTSRGRRGAPDVSAQYVWRNMLFRNLGSALSSDLIKLAVAKTYLEWSHRYQKLPLEILRTEINPNKIRSKNPGYCYKVAGFHNTRKIREKVYLDAPCPTRVWTGGCGCCSGSRWDETDTEMISVCVNPVGTG
jgi:hypothetical protein